MENVHSILMLIPMNQIVLWYMSLVTISAKTSLVRDFHAVLPYAFYCSLGLTRNQFSFIAVVEDLFRRREPLPSMDVVYFIQPTKEK